MMDALLQDLRYGVRMLLRRPSVTAAAVLSLSLGIGANTTIFTWVKSVLLDPFPGVPNAARMVVVGGLSKSGSHTSLSYPDYRDYREKSHEVLSGLLVQRDAAIALSTGSETDHPERLWGALVSGNYFDVLGVHAALGRTFAAEEDRTPGTHAVAVISHDLWRRRFASDVSTVGRTVTINGYPFTIVGITPQNFIGTFMGLATDLWIPLMMDQQVTQLSRLEARGNRFMQSLGVLQPGVGKAQAQAALSAVATQLSQTYSDSEGRGIAVYSVWDSPWGAAFALRPVLLVLSAVVMLVLIMACANVANLLLARAVGRRREVAMRLSLGASRTRLLRQLLTESVVLSLLGGVGGIVVAYWASGSLMAFIPPTDTPIKLMLGIDWPTIEFAFIISLLTGIVFGVVPALQSSNPSLVTSLKDETSGSAGGRMKGRLRSALVVAQVAVSLVLLIGAGLFLQSLRRAQNLDAGFEVRNALLASYDLSSLGYSRERGLNFHKAAIERLKALPGVRTVSLARRVPMGFDGSSSTGVGIDGYEPAPNEEVVLEYNVVGPDYFKTMQIPLLRGREFNATDQSESTRVVLINETMAKRYWKNREALGGRIRIGETWHEVIGITKDGKYHSLSERPMPFFYFPVLQSYTAGVVLHIATETDPASVLPAVRQAIHTLDPNLPLFEIKTMQEYLQIAVFAQHIAATLLSAMGAMAVILATVGLYGVIAYAVSQRTKEVGIRLALGAQRSDILRMVVRQGAGLAGLGIGLGLILAFAGAQLLTSLLQGVSASDPLVFTTVPLLLGAVAIIASYVPARKATKTDPMIALRYE